MSRVVSWFSCGAASAVATKLAIERHKDNPLIVAYTKVAEEHPDNNRFLADCENWFGRRITVLKNERYDGSIVNVFNKVRYMGGISGAPCTTHLKKEVRKRFERPDDIQVFGFTVEEKARLDRFIDANASVKVEAPLIDAGLTKEDCLGVLSRAGIELPMMYKLGYNNNCIGCVKGGAGYWNKIRKDFPEIFKLRAEQSRRIGARLVKVKGKRIFLDELPEDAGNYPKELAIECGIACELAEKTWRENEI